MNRRILLVAMIVLTLITAVVHLALGGGMIGVVAGGGFPAGGPPGGFQPPSDGQGPDGGQPPQNGPPPGGAPGGTGFLLLPILFVLNGIGYLALFGSARAARSVPTSASGRQPLGADRLHSADLCSLLCDQQLWKIPGQPDGDRIESRGATVDHLRLPALAGRAKRGACSGSKGWRVNSALALADDFGV